MAKRRVVPFVELGDAGSFMEGADTPMAIAILGGACIENALGSLLIAALIDMARENGEEPTWRLLNNPYGTLSSFSARADLCYCLGLITREIYDNAKNVATIRNRFAHSHVPIDFTDSEVVRLCNDLNLTSVTDQTGKPFEIKDHLTPKDISESGMAEEDYHRVQLFILAVTFTHMAIQTSAVGVEKRKPRDVAFHALVGGVNVNDPSDRAPIIFFNK